MFFPFGRRLAWNVQGFDSHHCAERQHHHHREHHGHHERHEQPEFGGFRHFFGRRGFFGGFGPFGPNGPFGPERAFQEGKRFFGKGDLKFALLELLQERPMHGYELIKALEEKSGGMYSPSPGSIYPTLQLLEDRDLISAAESDGKKVYQITEQGKQALAERKQEEKDAFANPIWERFRKHASNWNNQDMHALRQEGGEVAQLFAMAGRASINNPAKMKKLRAILQRTRKELADLLVETENTESEAAE